MAYKFNPFTGQLDDAITLTGSGSVAAAQDGTAALPGISFANDLNTGIYRPGADQVAIATNGTGRLFVDASGNVGVGSSPGFPFHAKAISDGSALAVACVENTGVLASTESRLQFVQGGNTTRGAYVGGLNESASGQPTSFVIGTSAAYSAPTERLRITSDGKLGLGTSTPSEALDVIGRVRSQWDVYVNGGGTSYAGDAASLVTGSTAGMWAARSDSALLFSIGSNEKVRIDSSGRVGVGTTEPNRRLELVDGNNTLAEFSRSTAGEGAIRVGNIDGNVYLGSSQGDVNITASSSTGRFFFNSGANNRLTIDNSGRLLVGTSSARANFYNSPVDSRILLESNSISSGERILANVHTSASANGPIFLLAKSRSASIGGNTLVVGGDAIGTIDFQGNDGSEFVGGARIQAEVDGAPGANDMPGRLVFSTTADGASSPTERMRLNNSGNLNVFSGDVIYARSSAAAGLGNYFYSGWHSATGTTDGTLSFAVYTNGNVQNTNNSYGALSDVKLKENIVEANSQWSDIKALQVRNYNFKEGQTHTQLGLIAQEVELVSPGLVSESPDRDEGGNDLGTVTKSVNYSVLYMKAVKALQEAMERIETLEAKVAALESA